MVQPTAELIIETSDPAVIQMLREAGAKPRRRPPSSGFEPFYEGRSQGLPGRMRGDRPFGFPDHMMGRGMGGGAVMDVGQFVLDLVHSDPAVHAAAVVGAAGAAVAPVAKGLGEIADSGKKVLDLIQAIGERQKARRAGPSSELISSGAANLDSQRLNGMVKTAVESGASIKIIP